MVLTRKKTKSIFKDELLVKTDRIRKKDKACIHRIE